MAYSVREPNHRINIQGELALDASKLSGTVELIEIKELSAGSITDYGNADNVATIDLYRVGETRFGSELPTISFGGGFSNASVVKIENYREHSEGYMGQYIKFDISNRTEEKGSIFIHNLPILLEDYPDEQNVQISAEISGKTYHFDVGNYSGENRDLGWMTLKNAKLLNPSYEEIPFDKKNEYYESKIPYNQESVTLYAEKEAGTTLKINGQPYESHTDLIIPVSYGENEIEIEVFASDGSSKDYEIWVYRDEPEHSTLYEITMDKGGLTPTFNPNIYAYNVSVDSEERTLKLKTKASHDAWIKVDGEDYISDGHTIDVSNPSNEVQIEVKDNDKIIAIFMN